MMRYLWYVCLYLLQKEKKEKRAREEEEEVEVEVEADKKAKKEKVWKLLRLLGLFIDMITSPLRHLTEMLLVWSIYATYFYLSHSSIAFYPIYRR